jgi:cyanophycinase
MLLEHLKPVLRTLHEGPTRRDYKPDAEVGSADFESLESSVARLEVSEMFKAVRQRQNADALAKKIDAVVVDPKFYKGDTNSQGNPHGFGIYSYVDGSIYEGQWEDGIKQGKGTWTYPNSDKYVGDWANGHKHGFGIWTLSNSDRYEGQFFNDARNGKGTYYFGTGDLYVGDYVEDIKEGFGEYRAKVTTPCRDVATSGKYRYFAGDFYVGQYHKNNRHGIGKQTSANGDVYEGEWVDHYRSGRGKLKKANGQVIVAIWKDDQIDVIISDSSKQWFPCCNCDYSCCDFSCCCKNTEDKTDLKQNILASVGGDSSSSSPVKGKVWYTYSRRRLYYVIFAVINIFLLIFLLLFFLLPGNGSSSLPYIIFCIGNCTQDKVTNTTPGVIIMGGGHYVNDAILWQIKNADGGDYVILRGSDIGVDEDDWMNDYVYNLALNNNYSLNSITTVQWLKREASYKKEVLEILESADALWFAGGDQSLYMDYWLDTPALSIINSKIKNVTVGGTSAGAAILGNWIFTSSDGTVTSYEAINDPYSDKITISTVPLFHIPYLEQVITDTHFVTRNRMGRLLAFLGRIITDNAVSDGIKGIGVDEDTALLLNVTTGMVTAVGNNTAHVCSGVTNGPETCMSGSALTYSNITCIRLNAMVNSTISLSTYQAENSVQYCNNVTDGHINYDHYGPKFNFSGELNNDDYYLYNYMVDDTWFTSAPSNCPNIQA